MSETKQQVLIILTGLAIISLTLFCRFTLNGGTFQNRIEATKTPFLPLQTVSSLEVHAQPEQVTQRLLMHWPEEISVIEEGLVQASIEWGIDPLLFTAVIYKESWFNSSWERGWQLCPDGPVTTSCTSTAGAIGPAQVMPFHFTDGEDPRDLYTNLSKGAEVLAGYIRLMGSVKDGLASYNCGPGNAHKAQCQEYATDVLSIYARYVGYAYNGDS